MHTTRLGTAAAAEVPPVCGFLTSVPASRTRISPRCRRGMAPCVVPSDAIFSLATTRADEARMKRSSAIENIDVTDDGPSPLTQPAGLWPCRAVEDVLLASVCCISLVWRVGWWGAKQHNMRRHPIRPRDAAVSTSYELPPPRDDHHESERASENRQPWALLNVWCQGWRNFPRPVS